MTQCCACHAIGCLFFAFLSNITVHHSEHYFNVYTHQKKQQPRGMCVCATVTDDKFSDNNMTQLIK